jgi:hypothetical protein
MASPSNSHDDFPPSLSADIERVIPREIPIPMSVEEALDLKRMADDAWQHRAGFARTRGATEPSSAYKTILLTERQINYLLVILKPYVSPIAEECRVKLESA